MDLPETLFRIRETVFKASTQQKLREVISTHYASHHIHKGSIPSFSYIILFRIAGHSVLSNNTIILQVLQKVASTGSLYQTFIIFTTTI